MGLLLALSLAQPVSLRAQSVATFSGPAAKQQVEALAVHIGSRPAGSAAYDQAVGYVADQLRQWGYQPVLQPFPVQTYEDHGSRLQLDTGQALEANTLTYSVGGDVTAPLVAAGLGQPADLVGLDVRGKLALVQRGTLRFSDKVHNLAEAGAVGVIVYNDSAGPVLGSLISPEAVPAVTVSAETGQQLLGLLDGSSGPPTVRLVVDGATVERMGTNVIADLPGASPDAGVVLFGAHLDSVPAGPGANDNGSGSAVVLELAHELAQRSPSERPLAVRFAWWGAEELGLFGSRYYVQNLSDADRRALLGNVNLDMVGVGQSWRFGGTDDLVQLALGAATDIGERAVPLRGPLEGASDHASFTAAGIPAVFLYRTDDPNYHTANDKAEFVDPDALAQAGTLALKVLDGLAQPPTH